MNDNPAYGLWSLVLINSLVFIIFAFSFAKPQSPRDWRSFGAFSAFLVALFTEMYGFPLTLYLLSGWLASRFPGVDWSAHDSGHLLEMVFGWRGNPHFGPFHLLSTVFIIGGFALLSAAWKVLYQAQRAHRLATAAPTPGCGIPSTSASSSSWSASSCSGSPSSLWPCSPSWCSCTCAWHGARRRRRSRPSAPNGPAMPDARRPSFPAGNRLRRSEVGR
jgi:hypothetical protein